VICRQCGTEIADKAIVCYRCGAATAQPVRRAATSAGRRRGFGLVMPAVILVIIAAAVVLLPRTPEGWPRAAGYAVAALVTLAAVLLVRRWFRR
jgi:hypothetical protein